MGRNGTVFNISKQSNFFINQREYYLFRKFEEFGFNASIGLKSNSVVVDFFHYSYDIGSTVFNNLTKSTLMRQSDRIRTFPIIFRHLTIIRLNLTVPEMLMKSRCFIRSNRILSNLLLKIENELDRLHQLAVFVVFSSIGAKHMVSKCLSKSTILINWAEWHRFDQFDETYFSDQSERIWSLVYIYFNWTIWPNSKNFSKSIFFIIHSQLDLFQQFH